MFQARKSVQDRDVILAGLQQDWEAFRVCKKPTPRLSHAERIQAITYAAADLLKDEEAGCVAFLTA